MNIGEAARASGVTAKMIRHYESIGLIHVGPRTLAGYRQYQARDVHVLRFIRRARDLGFSLDAIRELLSLWDDPDRASADVKKLAECHIAELDTRIAALTDMRETLSRLADACHGDHRPDCPILHGLAECESRPASASPSGAGVAADRPSCRSPRSASAREPADRS